MLKFSKINPAARAIGTVGVVTALVGVVTFAQDPSNTVSLTNNTLTAGTASLAIEADAACENPTTSTQGMSFTNLVPGQTSAPFTFCVDNTGNVPQSIAISSPTDFAGSTLDPNSVTLNITCGVGGATTGEVSFSNTVASLNTPQAFDNALNNGTNNVLSCQATASIPAGTAVTSNSSINPFTINFDGTAGS